MADDVVARYLRRGMPVRQVRSLLGPPDEVADRGGTLVYNVDFEDDGLLGTCVLLEINASRGRLSRAAVARDE